MSIYKFLGAAVSGLLLMASQNAFAQQPTSTSETYGDWTYRCNQVASPAEDVAADAVTSETPVVVEAVTKMVCETTQVLQDAQGNVIAQIAFGLNPDAADKIVAVFQVPQGTLLSVPVRFGAQGANDIIEAPYVTCVNSICLARTLVDKTVISTLGASEKGTLTFVDQSGRNINVLLSLAGLTVATDRLVVQN